eukprot:TRINITY_DN7047_c0_g2_i1.p1 TRINITY_DN7047_c0_g2~~TRINITY_DN7047_c0_g2_i1.p1  ORF type:complete len:1532 (-),score=327.28 TRINITY_DN7047_c0_g2_i1:331-4371(-)
MAELDRSESRLDSKAVGATKQKAQQQDDRDEDEAAAEQEAEAERLALEAEQRRLAEEERIRRSRLPPELEHRVFGSIAFLTESGQGEERIEPQLVMSATEALRIVSRNDRGAAALAEFRGLEIALKYAGLGSQVDEDAEDLGGFGLLGMDVMNMASMTAATGDIGLSVVAPTNSRSCFGCFGKAQQNDDNSPGNSPGRSPGDSPGRGQVGRSKARAERDVVQVNPEDIEILTTDNCFACLRNLAAHEVLRKDRILEGQGATFAVNALRKYWGSAKEEAREVSRSCAALLRNLTEGASNSSSAVTEAGVLAIIQEELEDAEAVAGPHVRRHLIGTLQNLAANVADLHIHFGNRTAGLWIKLCDKSLSRALDRHEVSLTNQILAATANLSIICSAQRAKDLEEGLVSEDVSPAEDALSARSGATGTSKATPILDVTKASADDDEEEDEAEDEAEEQDADEAEEEDAAKSLREIARSSGSGSASELQSKASADDKDDSEEESSKEETTAGPSCEVSEEVDDTERSERSEESESAKGWKGVAFPEAAEEEEEDAESEGTTTTNQLILQKSLDKAMKKVDYGTARMMIDLIADSKKRPGLKAKDVVTPKVASNALRALCNLAQDTDVERMLGSMDAIKVVLEAMNHLKSVDFQLEAMRFLWNMTFSNTNQTEAVKLGVIGMVTVILDVYREPHNAVLHAQGCGVLRNLCVGSNKHKRALLLGGMVPTLCKSLRLYPKELEVQRQAAAGLMTICEGAPPAAFQVTEHGGVSAMVKALKNKNIDFKLANQLLAALESMLMQLDALPYFCVAGGHNELLHVLVDFFSQDIQAQVLRTIAMALSHTKEPETCKKTLEEMTTQLVEGDGDDDEDVDPESDFNQRLRERLRVMPCSQMRTDLIENNIWGKVIDAMTNFESPKICKAAVGIFRNLAVQVDNPLEAEGESKRHLDRKREAAQRVGVLCSMVPPTDEDWDEETRHDNAGFVANILSLCAACCLDHDSAVRLFKNQMVERAAEWMEEYSDEKQVQVAACEFIGNLSMAKLRLRQACVESGCIQDISDLLETHKRSADVVVAACKSLQCLAADDHAPRPLRHANTLEKCLTAMDEHIFDANVQAASVGLLWNLSLSARIMTEMVEKNVINRVLQCLFQHSGSTKVVTQVGGFVRNLVTDGTLGAKVAKLCLAEGGQRQLVECLWLHCCPPEETPQDQQAAGQARAAKSRIARTQVLKTGVNGEHTSKVRNLDWKATPASTSCAEQVFAALNNLCTHDANARAIAAELVDKDEFLELKLALEYTPMNAMIQFQGFCMVNKIMSIQKETRDGFRPMSDHVLLMSHSHRKTPVSDIGELVLEAIS